MMHIEKKIVMKMMSLFLFHCLLACMLCCWYSFFTVENPVKVGKKERNRKSTQSSEPRRKKAYLGFIYVLLKNISLEVGTWKYIQNIRIIIMKDIIERTGL